ncbi:protein THEMIS2 [Sardina pilchardus]|uniref:protein THEMIS2 n=1 Tax=Sardina pilchardus TaxID=27697 RepID=UPI002E0DBD83
MDGSGTVLPLQEFIASLDCDALPRILQVCSGVYFQGSVYELSGSEVCLSTGDLVKVIGLKLLSGSCVDIATDSTCELPVDHKGLFKMVAEDMPYDSLEEMVSLLPVGVDTVGSLSFISRSELIIDNFIVPAGQELTLLSSEQGCARCQVTGPEGSTAEVRIPLNHCGAFYESQSEHGYSLEEILSSTRLRSRRFRSLKAKACGGPLVFSPIYQIEAIMHMRKNVVNFPSSLEVDVVDVTDECKNVEFVKPLTLVEVSAQPPDAFPTVAEILEAPEGSRHLFSSAWHTQLQNGHRLLLHGCGRTNMVLASTPKGRKAQQYFLIWHSYGGRLRRKAREFGSVYELYVASSRAADGLRVSVTRNCEAVEEEGLPELDIGDQLDVLRCEQVELAGVAGDKQKVEALVCRRRAEEDDDDDDDDDDDEGDEEREGKGSREDTIYLPLYMGAQFVEVITDKKKYTLAELGKDSWLPLDIKVATRDPGLEKDPLTGLPALRLEEASAEPTVLASLLDKPQHCFQLPTQWLHMSVSFTSDALPWPKGQPPKLYQETVTEVKEHFYYEFRKLTNIESAPPPRPPKRKTSVGKPKKPAKSDVSRSGIPAKSRSLSSSFSQLELESEKPKRSPAPPLPMSTEDEPPPVRPRKPDTRKGSTSVPSTNVKEPQKNTIPITEDEPPPLLPRKPDAKTGSTSVPNTYVKAPQKKKGKERQTSDSDDHDYETVEEMVRNAQESVMYY